ncbi:unnamed protein product [Moneuplotes crassus]|uniref:Uncharacterized protein n=1 Tax=Euplotes crassus TaxID=5936 RepID=A0AAD1U796_EUPCR|nr:unnamed protein product [Moneuplotes crassus]
MNFRTNLSRSKQKFNNTSSCGSNIAMMDSSIARSRAIMTYKNQSSNFGKLKMKFNKRIQLQTKEENLFSKNSIAFDDSCKVFEGNPSFDSKEVPRATFSEMRPPSELIESQKGSEVTDKVIQLSNWVKTPEKIPKKL